MQLSQILKKGFWILVFKSFGALLSFVALLLIAQVLGVKGYGLFMLGLTITNILSIFVRLGLDNVVLKNVSSLRESSPMLSEGYLVSTLKVVIVVSVFMMFFLYSTAEIISTNVFDKPNFASVFQIFVFLIPVNALVFIFAEYFKAILKPLFSTFWQSIFPPLLFIFLCLFSIFYGYEISLETIVYFWILGFVGSLIIFYVFRFLQKSNRLIKKIRLWKLINQGIPMLMVSSGALVLAWSDIIILGILGTDEDVGIYSAASRIVLVTSLLLMAINALTAPVFSRLYNENKIEELAKVAKLSTNILAVTVFIPTLVLFTYPDEILGLFGNEFKEGVLLLPTLAVGQFINVSCGSVGYLLTMTGLEKKFSYIMLTTAAINIFLSVFLFNIYGILGVALSTAISIIIWNFWAVYEVKKHLGFLTLPIPLLRSKTK